MTIIAWPTSAEKAITLRRISSAYNVVTGKNTETPTDYATRAVIGEYETELIDGDVIQSGDLRLEFWAARTAVIPTVVTTTTTGTTTRDQVIIDGEAYQVHGVQPHYFGDTALSYSVQVRR